jgi:murein DD-endopeptidase MepM/ murein hydrolase activator NlpD
MNSAVELVRPWLSLLALALTAIAAAGCSPDSTRFLDNAYGPRSPDATGSIASGQTAPVGRVETKPLPQTSPPPQSAAHSAPAASHSPPPSTYASEPPPPAFPAPTPVAYSPPPGPESTGTVKAPAPIARKRDWDGGTAITVAPGETLDAIARRHGVPVSVILEANNLASPNAIRAGQRLVIPRYNSTAAGATPSNRLAAVGAPKSVPPPALAAAPVTAVPATVASTAGHAAGAGNNPAVHVVANGETLTKIAHQYGKPLAEIAKANNMAPSAKLSIGDRIIIPGVRVGAARPESDRTTPDHVTAGKEPASAGPVQNASLATPSVEAQSVEGTSKAGADASPGFRWPVRGRIIAGFGPKPNGQQNDGIDVAVPENTPVKAAEDGVVAYAGNELKGYGNLVLVRHPNGYVTAYAHAKELLVKRGDQIKRGQVIAKSGQTGNVDAPQLHFEVRKGSAPIDPMQFLNGA